MLDKVGGLALLEGRGVGGARALTRLTRAPSERRAGERADGPVRRRRLRAIADEDLRERYGGKPSWLEAGALAQTAADGLVVVWAIGRGVAQVQSLRGGETHWVKLSDLSPPTPGWAHSSGDP
jgi:hypothetical protein